MVAPAAATTYPNRHRRPLARGSVHAGEEGTLWKASASFRDTFVSENPNRKKVMVEDYAPAKSLLRAAVSLSDLN